MKIKLFEKLIEKKLVLILFLALFYRFLAAYFNFGIVAVDDYLTMIRNFLPAQNQIPIQEMLFSDSVHPRFPILCLRYMASFIHALGVTDPLNQLQILYSFMGVGSLCSGILLSSIFLRRQRQDLFLISVLLFGFYFLSPFVGTRVMNENFAFIFINCFGYFLYLFWETGKEKYIYASVFLLALASYCRFQSGFLILAVMATLFNRGTLKSLLHFFLASGLAFLFTGYGDSIIFSDFHFGLKKYLEYNLHYSSSYSASPFYNYILFFIAATIPPLLLSRYKKFQWKTQYSDLLPILWGLFVFVVIHSLVPHKEDRFMFPILGFFFILLSPVISYFRETKKTKRLWLFAVFNLVFGFLSIYYPSQWNSIGVVRFLRDNPNIKTLVNVDRSLQFVPLAYMEKNLPTVIEEKNFDPTVHTSCDTVVLLRFDKISSYKLTDYKALVSFGPGFLEKLLVHLNPKNNARRGPTTLFHNKLCK